MTDFQDKIALVTGATGGIGQAIARRLHEGGARVALTGTRAEVLEAVAGELGERVVAIPANLTDADAAKDLVASVEERLGGLDVLVSNAGATRDQLLLRMKDEDWEAVLTLNLSAYFRLARAALRGMMKRRYGRIVAITSVVGHTGNPGQANYVAAKSGMTGFTKALALEAASRGVTANCVAPGFIATAMTDVLTDAQKDAIMARIPMGAMGAPEDVAEAEAYLASAEARYVTGQTLHVNGGMAMM